MLSVKNCLTLLPSTQGGGIDPEDFGTVSLGPSFLAALGYEALSNGRCRGRIGVVTKEAVDGRKMGNRGRSFTLFPGEEDPGLDAQLLARLCLGEF
jgi:hypothetical protein